MRQAGKTQPGLSSRLQLQTRSLGIASERCQEARASGQIVWYEMVRRFCSLRQLLSSTSQADQHTDMSQAWGQTSDRDELSWLNVFCIFRYMILVMYRRRCPLPSKLFHPHLNIPPFSDEMSRGIPDVANESVRP